MRVFKNRKDTKARIVEEMVNLEAGKLIVGEDADGKTLYPHIEMNNIKASIRTHVGFLYLPNDTNFKEFAESLIPMLAKHDKKHNHLAGYARLERGVGQFTTLKAKNTLSKVMCVEEPKLNPDNTWPDGNSVKIIDKNWRRSFIIDPIAYDISSKMSNSRFYWFVFPISVMIKNIEQFKNPRFHPTTQFVSIVYDKSDKLLAEHGEKLESNITFTYFKMCEKLVSFDPLLQIKKSPEKQPTMSPEDRAEYISNKKCPDCKKQFKSPNGLTRHMKNKTCLKKIAEPVGPEPTPTPVAPQNQKKQCPHCNKMCVGNAGLKTHMRSCKHVTIASQAKARQMQQEENLEKFNKMSFDEKVEHLAELKEHPEYMPQWNDVLNDAGHYLAICPKRGPIFELIKYYGRWDIFKHAMSYWHCPIISIPAVIHEEDFRNILIDNYQHKGFRALNMMRRRKYPNSTRFDKSEICCNCLTPLYDDIYVVLNKPESTTGYAVCRTCMHMDPSKFIAIRKLKDDTTTVLRVTYPESIDMLIDGTDFIPVKKEIMRAAFRNIYEEEYHGQTAMYLDYNPTKGWKHQNIKYLGWTGFPSDYINYASARKGRRMDTFNVFPMKKISS